MSKRNVRAQAAWVIEQVIDKGQSLATCLPQAQSQLSNPKDKGLLAEICYGVMRQLPVLDSQVLDCLEKPLKGKKRIIHCLLLAGLYQLKHMRVKQHAAVTETVEATRQLKASGMSGLVNGIMRRCCRELDSLLAAQFDDDARTHLHSRWFIERVKAAYPDQWQQILHANNQHPPLWLRNSVRHQSRETYLAQLAEQGIDAVAGDSDNALRLLKATDVTKLPGFAEGGLSVQDQSAQWAAYLLDPQPGERILDACAAPGGKTCHLQEQQPELQHLVALDIDDRRLARVQQNLDRLGQQAQLVAGDAADPQAWWDGIPFDRILLDAPCSATGVIRRNPDSKWLRRNDDIDALAQLQQRILHANWRMLKPGGTLVYATCSILPEENVNQIKTFLQQVPDAMLLSINPDDSQEKPGWQLLPQVEGGDGFYYARLKKKQ
ncbi:16S rRNA (cytosine(967)-C(5))-methyltransferase RsmB [Ferrimonas sp. SCSIO 43195]|uniref:16S rRNA (cytosine(967)-C(5))-methyltransferase RsmB n=1 Tax=Ferrimonas sp. SCSIO 43195 TaxID=2822844 RepID=UPI002075DEAB|nr:16S rRNA (cytosine(967)-C(5))-methyltransferase RsmB [Ferrimonas sp. SCSIO 43195]USD37595.1 16S rRNA (cytosine(967)-C(5))-methyltransferase RsmB [Ferrimonas sp. SCSIO 43195]